MKRLGWYEVNELAAQAGCRAFSYLAEGGGKVTQNAYCIACDEYHAGVEHQCKKN